MLQPDGPGRTQEALNVRPPWLPVRADELFLHNLEALKAARPQPRAKLFVPLPEAERKRPPPLPVREQSKLRSIGQVRFREGVLRWL